MKTVIRAFSVVAVLLFCGVVHATTEWNAQDYDLYAGDFNGDGLTDVLYIAKDPSMPSGIALSDGTGPNIAWQAWPSNFLGIQWSGNAYHVIVADFNGDGKADIFLQSAVPGNNYLLLTSNTGLIVGISQTVANNAMGLTWSADQHHIIAGAFTGSVNGHPKADLFLQATSATGTDAIVLSDVNGMFTAAAPVQTWTDGYLGFNWNTKAANVFAGDFNGDGLADLLIQAKPVFAIINYTVPFPVPTYAPNMNGVVLAKTELRGSLEIFVATGVQAWSRINDGVDWSPLTSTIVIDNGSSPATVVLQGLHAGLKSYELVGNKSGAIFGTATALSANVSLTADSYHLLVGNFSKGATGGLYFQSLTPGGSNYVADAIGPTITASADNPTSVTGTVEPTSAGRTAGQFSITPNGGASYNIPIWTPPGARQIEPHLALHYASGGPDGVMGPGWSLTGLSAIARCGKTWASTGGTASVVGHPSGVTLATSDDLCIDGNRLRLTSGVQGMGGSTYMTEIADFSLVTANGSASSPLTSFTVQGKDGRYYEYGNGRNSSISASGAAAPYVWALDKVSDRQGNNMVFNYTPKATILSVASIQYTATPGATSTSPGYQVNFTYASARTGGTSLTKYVAGSAATQSQQLSNIQVLSLLPSATLVRQYNLGYAASPTTSRPLLTSVQECGGATGADCIRPTTLDYQAGAAGWTTTATATGLTGQYGFLPLDLNGDGIPDALYGKLSGSNIQWFARIATIYGYGAEIATGATTSATATTNQLIPGTFSGKGLTQFLAPVGNVWYVYTYGASGFTAASTGVTLNSEQSAVDYDGDGLPDLVSFTYSGGTSTLAIRRNTTAPGAPVSFASATTAVYTATGTFAALGDDGGIIPMTADFNGDGRGDFVFTAYSGTRRDTPSTQVVLSNGFGALATVVNIGDSSLNGQVGDWNGDGCSDVITQMGVYLSNCSGGFTHVAAAVPVGTNGYVPFLAVDWDGDGQTDRIYADPTTNIWFLQRSTGSGLAAAVSTGVPVTGNQTFFLMDRNSDGQPDLGFIDSSNGYAVSYYLHNGAYTPPDLAANITDGFGIFFAPTYAPITPSTIYNDYYIPGTTAVFPDIDVHAPMYVVNQFSAADGTGGVYLNSFIYEGARLNLQGRGFEGFAETISIDFRSSIEHNTSYVQAFPLIGAVSEDDYFQPGGYTPIATTKNVNLSKTLVGSGAASTCATCYFGYVDNSTSNHYEIDIGGAKNGAPVSSTYTKYLYDAYGTLTSTTATVTDTDSTAPASPFVNQQWVTQVANTIYNNDSPSVWCLGRPTKTTSTTTAPGQPALTRTVEHTMDPSVGGQSDAAYGNCRAQTEVVEPGTSLQVTTTFGFDSCGNTNSASVVGLDETGAAMPARTTLTSYGTRCQMPESVQNPLQQTSYTSYDYDFGTKASATDANGVTVRWSHDDFTRKTLESRPDGTSTSWSFADCVESSCWGTPDLRFQTTETLLDANGNTVRVHETIADGMDRVRYDEGNRVLGVWNTSVTKYDSLGRKTEYDLPYSSSGNGYHLYSYDLGNRPLTDTLYTSSGSVYRQIVMAYLGQTATVKDPKLNTTTKVTDVSGKLRSVTDPPEGVHGASAGTTAYTYDSLGNLTKIVDAIGATSSYSYNIRGFKTGSADADSGTWSLQPDSLNELKKQTDANGAVTKFTYDLLGRMLTRLEPESTTATVWTYGTTASLHNIGQLASVTKPDGYAESDLYDSIGRPQTKIYTEDGTNYQFDYAYNAQGTLATVTYPVSTSGVRFALKYLYDSAGYLNSEQDASSGAPFWTLTSASDNSTPTMEVLGNAVSVATGYTPWTNEMVSRTEGNAGSTTNLQNLAYSWDLNGNLGQRVDKRQNLTEAFTVDALNRLSTVTLNGQSTLSVQYDKAGDITNKSDVGAYTYGSPAHPHAVTAAGSWTIGYDANGNMNSRAGGSITSYSYNLPNQINYNGSSAQFDYNSNHQRWKQVANYGGTPETTHYIGGLLEVVTHGSSPTEYRHQIPAGSSTVVYTRRTDGSTGTYYATSDHLGSSDLVMDASANVLVRESFTPFGARRGSNWQSIPSTADYTAIQSTTRQGFTGHEMLDSVGLVHMNGRVYDPTLGRFLSADTVIQSLGITQSVNPYSYAWNNPLTFTDPTGHSLLGDIIGLIITIVVAIWLPELLPEYFSAYSPATLAVAGFVGGFVGAYISTGSLSAALTGGLIAGATAFAFAEIGSYASQMEEGSEWAKPFSVLAHAAVGCGSAMLSGGNCGRGALAAGISEVANQANLIEPPGKSLASWGTLKGAAEAGLIGGIAARISGGKFDEGFTVSAAGYLFNSALHPKNLSPTASQAGGGIPYAFVGGAHDYPNGAAYGAYLAYIAANPDSAAAYFQWNQGAALANWIDANNGEVVVYAHSWGGDTAASVVAAGHDVAALITVDPVSWTRPNFQLVATNAGIWIDYNALGGTGFSFSNLVAGVGDAWDAAPAKFATLYQTINLNHVDVMCAVAPSGCR